MSNYILSLLDRMESNESLPVKEGEIRQSSTHGISWIAYREAEKIDNIQFLPTIKEFLEKPNKADRFRNLLFLLGHLAKNSQDPSAKSLFVSLLERKKLKAMNLAHWVFCAEKCRIVEVEPLIGELFYVKHAGVLTKVLHYCATMRSECYLEKICEILDHDCYGLCHPMYAVDALRSIKDEKAIPYLEKAIKRREFSKRQQDTDVVGSAKTAIWMIQGELQEYMPYGKDRT